MHTLRIFFAKLLIFPLESASMNVMLTRFTSTVFVLFLTALLLHPAKAATPSSSSDLVFSFDYSPEDLQLDLLPNGMVLPELPDCQLPPAAAGTPALPAQDIQVLLPPQTLAASISVRTRWQTIDLTNRITPVQPDVPLSVPAPSAPVPPGALYMSTNAYPEQAAILITNQSMRGRTLAAIRLHPLRYYPKLNRLQLATTITISIQLNAPTRATTLSLPTSDAPLFDSLRNALVINPEQQRALTTATPSAACDYLIITSATLSNSFQQLATHRASQNSISTRVLTLDHINAAYSGLRPDGSTDTQTRIRQCITDYVNNQGTTYVVLGGDSSVVPDRDCAVSCGSYSETKMPTDLYYSGLDGTWDGNANGTYGETGDSVDLTYDVIVGRIPVRTSTQADAYISKLIQFETSSHAASSDAKILLLADELWDSFTGSDRPTDTCSDGLPAFQAHSPVSDGEQWTRRLFRDGIAAAWTNQAQSMFFDTATSWDTSTAGDYLQSSTQVQNRFNEGWNHVYFATHGSSGTWSLESGSYGTSSAATLTNLTALVYTMACLTGRFDDVDPCLSEAFLRNGNGGALVYMGCSRYGWGSPGSYDGGTSAKFARKFYDQVFSTKQNFAGIAFAQHKQQYASSSTYNGSYRWVQFGLNLQGDPLVPIYRADFIPGTDSFSFTAFALTNSVILRWPDPVSCGMQNRRVRIECSTSAYPSSPTTSTLVYEGTEQTYTHTDCTPDQSYYYTIWVSDDGTTWTEPP